MLGRVPHLHALASLLSLALGACGSSEGFGGTTGTFCTDAGRLQCCMGGCEGTTLAAPICDASGWQCPGGSVLEASCPEAGFCVGPVCSAPAGFACCKGGCDSAVADPPVCTSTGWACPAGDVNSQLCPGQVCLGTLPPPLRSPAGAMDGPSGPE